MRSAQKVRKLFLLLDTADEIHVRHSTECNDVWKDAKEQIAYENVLRDVDNAKRALKRTSHSRISITRWLAVTVATLSIEEYIKKFNLI